MSSLFMGTNPVSESLIHARFENGEWNASFNDAATKSSEGTTPVQALSRLIFAMPERFPQGYQIELVGDLCDESTIVWTLLENV